MAAADVANGLVSTLPENGLIGLAASIAIGLSALATAWSQQSIGSAAMGAVSERPELKGNVLIWIALPETIVLFGFIMAFLILQLAGSH